MKLFLKHLSKTVEVNFDWDKECTRRVKEFSMYSERLREIDWKAAIAAKKDWKDPYFPAN